MWKTASLAFDWNLITTNEDETTMIRAKSLFLTESKLWMVTELSVPKALILSLHPYPISMTRAFSSSCLSSPSWSIYLSMTSPWFRMLNTLKSPHLKLISNGLSSINRLTNAVLQLIIAVSVHSTLQFVHIICSIIHCSGFYKQLLAINLNILIVALLLMINNFDATDNFYKAHHIGLLAENRLQKEQ